MKRKIIFEYAVSTLVVIVILSACAAVGAAIGYYAATEKAKEAKETEVEPSTYVQTVEQATPVMLKASVLEPIVEPTPDTLKPTGYNLSPVDETAEPIDVSEYMTVKYTDDDVYCLAAVIYQEAGGDCCSDDTRRMVADVVLNRVEDERFPDTVRGVLEDAPNGALQYGVFALTGVCFPKKAELKSEKTAVMRAWDIAYGVAAGEHSELYGNGYIWQSEYKQSEDSFLSDGIWFGR